MRIGIHGSVKLLSGDVHTAEAIREISAELYHTRLAHDFVQKGVAFKRATDRQAWYHRDHENIGNLKGMPDSAQGMLH